MMAATRTRVLLIAALLGLLAAFLVFNILKNAPGKGAEEASITVLTAKMDIEPRTEVTVDMVAASKLPKQGLRKDVITMPRGLIGKVTTMKILAGEPFLASKLAVRGRSLGMAFEVPEGMRAVTLANDQVIGVAGFVKPQDRVDVIATFNPGEGHGSITRTVLQNVMVLASGNDVRDEKISGNQGKSTISPTVTLLVTPAEAEKVILAENRGKVRLVLRSNRDMAWMPTRGATLVSVAGVSDAPRSSAPAPAARPVQQPSVVYNPTPFIRPAVSPSSALTVIPHGSSRMLSEDSSSGPIIEVIRGTQRESVPVSDGS